MTEIEEYEKWVVQQFWEGIEVAIDMSKNEDIIEIMETVGWQITQNGNEIDGCPCFNCLHYGWELDSDDCNGNGRCFNCMQNGFGMHDATNLDNLLVCGSWGFGTTRYFNDEIEEGECECDE